MADVIVLMNIEDYRRRRQVQQSYPPDTVFCDPPMPVCTDGREDRWRETLIGGYHCGWCGGVRGYPELWKEKAP
jgi:hypothetical protein